MRLTIDGRDVTARDGDTVLTCALRHGIEIPHLCTHPNLPPFGACRLCLVEVDGLRGFPASCSTPAQDGMVVRTETPALLDLRRGILELILLEHPSACLVCGKKDLCEKYRPKAEKAARTTGCHTCNNKEVCEVRELADRLGVTALPVPPIYRNLPLERGDPFIDRDLNLCILCGRCVRICRHQHGSAVIDFIGRGSATRVGTAFGRGLVEAGCRFCGSCVDVCPTGCLADRYAKWHGAPEAVTETTCIFCDAGCTIRISTDRGRSFEARAADPDLPICALGRFAIPAFLNGRERLQAPRLRVGKALREVSWEEALRAAAVRLQPFVGEGFALVCDATSTLEDRHVFRRFAAEVMRSPHCLELEPDARGLASAELPRGVRAALLTGGFVDAPAVPGLDLLIVQDCYPGPLCERADFVFPAAVFAEVQGTVADASGAWRPLRRACHPPGSARPEWRIVADLAQALGGAGFDYPSAEAVTRQLGAAPAAPRADGREAPRAARDPAARRTHFRGHRLDERVAGLKLLPVGDAP